MIYLCSSTTLGSIFHDFYHDGKYIYVKTRGDHASFHITGSDSHSEMFDYKSYLPHNIEYIATNQTDVIMLLENKKFEISLNKLL
jgi:hypothetical protein